MHVIVTGLIIQKDPVYYENYRRIKGDIREKMKEFKSMKGFKMSTNGITINRIATYFLKSFYDVVNEVFQPIYNPITEQVTFIPNKNKHVSRHTLLSENGPVWLPAEKDSKF